MITILQNRTESFSATVMLIEGDLGESVSPTHLLFLKGLKGPKYAGSNRVKSFYDWFKYRYSSAAPAADCQLLVQGGF